jgi:hypothetical protein
MDSKRAREFEDEEEEVCSIWRAGGRRHAKLQLVQSLKIKRKELHMPRNILEASPWWWSNAGSQQNHVPIWWGLSISSEQKTELWNKAQCIQHAWPEEGAASQHSCCAQYWALQPWNTNFFVTACGVQSLCLDVAALTAPCLLVHSVVKSPSLSGLIPIHCPCPRR